MSKHTPGPWIVGPANQGPVAGTVPVHTADYMESYRGGQLICSVYGTAAFSDANACLIAAAPDLLDALRQWIDIHNTPAGFTGKYGKALDAAIAAQQLKVDAAASAARAAIAKATGETK